MIVICTAQVTTATSHNDIADDTRRECYTTITTEMERCFGLANCGATQKWILILISIWKLVLLLAIRTVLVASIRCVDSIYVVCRIHAHTHTAHLSRHKRQMLKQNHAENLKRFAEIESDCLVKICQTRVSKQTEQCTRVGGMDGVGDGEDSQGSVGDVHATLISHFTAKTTNTENRDVGIFLFHDVAHTR